jgi:hypothetical protein
MMNHLHPDQLAAIALEPEIGEVDDHAHLDECARCQREVELLRDVSARARQARPGERPPAPPESIWDNVVRELAESGDLRPRAVEGPSIAPRSRPRWWMPAPRPRPRWWAPASVAAVLVALAVIAAIAVLPLGDQEVVAEAALESLASVPGASAMLTAEGDARVLTVDTADLPAVDGYYELWLLTPDGERLVSLGPVEGAREHRIPASVDLDEYSVVDISREPADGDPSHSTDSVLRGPLRPTT